MITAIGNNFGAGLISLKDYQNEKLVVLNGKFSFNNKTEEFLTASVLEITVPALSIPKSGMSGCYIMFQSEGNFYGTTLKTWVKDRNTLCIEKLDYWSDQVDEYTIYLLSLYVPKGQRGVFELGKKTRLTLNNTTSNNNYGYNQHCYIDEHWCTIALATSSYKSEIDPYDDIVELGGFPTDVNIELPFGGDHINSKQKYGPDMLEASIKAGVLTVKNIIFGWGGMPRDNFLYAVCIRDKDN